MNTEQATLEELVSTMPGGTDPVGAEILKQGITEGWIVPIDESEEVNQKWLREGA